MSVLDLTTLYASFFPISETMLDSYGVGKKKWSLILLLSFILIPGTLEPWL